MIVMWIKHGSESRVCQNSGNSRNEPERSAGIGVAVIAWFSPCGARVLTGGPSA
jgi:hypothetical protein